MKENNKYFQAALQNFCWDVACADAIHHLVDLGYSAEEIVSRLTFPATITQVEKEIDKYKKAKEDSQRNGAYEYVRTTDEYGHSSFIRRRKEES